MSLPKTQWLLFLAHEKSCWSQNFFYLTVKSHLSLFSHWPVLTQMTLMALGPLERGHQWAGVQWVYKLYWTFVLAVWQSKHLLLKVYWMRTSSVILIEVTNLIVYHYSREPFKPFQKRANWERSKNERCILAPSKVNWQTFSPGFPLSPILPGLPSWPW